MRTQGRGRRLRSNKNCLAVKSLNKIVITWVRSRPKKRSKSFLGQTTCSFTDNFFLSLSPKKTPGKRRKKSEDITLLLVQLMFVVVVVDLIYFKNKDKSRMEKAKWQEQDGVRQRQQKPSQLHDERLFCPVNYTSRPDAPAAASRPRPNKVRPKARGWGWRRVDNMDMPYHHHNGSCFFQWRRCFVCRAQKTRSVQIGQPSFGTFSWLSSTPNIFLRSWSLEDCDITRKKTISNWWATRQFAVMGVCLGSSIVYKRIARLRGWCSTSLGNGLKKWPPARSLSQSDD